MFSAYLPQALFNSSNRVIGDVINPNLIGFIQTRIVDTQVATLYKSQTKRITPTPGLRLLGVTLVVWCAIFLTANTIAYFVG